MQIYLAIAFVGGGFLLGFFSAAILIVPRISPQLRNMDEYIRESLKPFRYLLNRDVKDMQDLYDTVADLVDELKDYREEQI